MKNSSWKLISEEKFKFVSEDMFADGAKSMPVTLFINTETGEVRPYSTYFVEKSGTDSIINLLNMYDKM